MTVWHYSAVPLDAKRPGDVREGEMTADSAAQARASLRRLGLQAFELREMRVRSGTPRFLGGEGIARYLRKRRQPQRADFYDGIATMLDSGVPLLDALETLLQEQRKSQRKNMMLELHEGLRSGSGLSEKMQAHADWFGAEEVAMVRAGEHSGNLPNVLRGLSERHERANELGQRLIGALIYPTVVSLVGIAAVIFLSVKTLPELTQILRNSNVEVPALTSRVMSFGQGLASHGLWLLAAIPLAGLAHLGWKEVALRRNLALPSSWRRFSPSFPRRVALAGFCRHLAELLRNAVPLVEALRVLAPTLQSHGLRRRVISAADRIERGESLSSALDDTHWFDAEFRRLIDLGQASGELDSLLEKLGARYERRTRRTIDRLTALLEPAVILLLAVGIGVVVVAAVLPMIRLQEILG